MDHVTFNQRLEGGESDQAGYATLYLICVKEYFQFIKINFWGVLGPLC